MNIRLSKQSCTKLFNQKILYHIKNKLYKTHHIKQIMKNTSLRNKTYHTKLYKTNFIKQKFPKTLLTNISKCVKLKQLKSKINILRRKNEHDKIP